MSPPLRPKPTAVLLFVSFLLVAFLYSILYSSSPSHGPPSNHVLSSPSADRLRALFLSLSAGANATIAAHLRFLTRRPHLAGTPTASGVAAYVLSHLRLAGIETHTVKYSPLLSYPAAASLSLHRADGALIKRLSLSEPGGSPDADVVIPYHAYSPSGAVSAPAVYANYGREDDYASLHRMGVDVRGCVVVVRRGSEYRGAVVARAAEKGAAAVLMFKERDAGGVERGTVLLGGTGDPLTPGWATPEGSGGERLSPEDDDVRRRFPSIPSMPVAQAVAAEILRTLDGPRFPLQWSVDSTTAKETAVGAGPTLVNFTYHEDSKLSTIQNIFGIIRGNEEPDRYVILGNHRDAWTYGAVDPNSGTSAFLDVARRYGALLRSGWKPRRTIILCSWDAEEFGMIGSTEWVEQNIKNLGAKAVSYLNVDCAVQGSGFFAGASPQLDKLLIDVIQQVKDPDSDNRTVYDTWIAKNQGISIDRLARADSDFSAFLHLGGIPSVDLYYGEEFSGYHTILDAYDWMEKHGDPKFHRHVAIAEIWGLLGLHLADEPFLPFDYLSYVAQLQEHITALSGFMENAESLQPINTSVHDLNNAIREVFKETKELMELDIGEAIVALRRRSLNDRLMLGERGFLDAKGLRGRKWFKHLLYSPPGDSESKFAFFPGITDAISEGRSLNPIERQARIQHEVWAVARAIGRAAGVIRGELT